MIRSLKCLLFGGIVLAAANAAQAGVLASSTFGSSVDGWTGADFGVYNPFPGHTAANGFYTTTPTSPLPDWSSGVGNPAGSLRLLEPGTNRWEFFQANSSFAGNKDWVNTPVIGGTENILGGTLKFDIRIDFPGTTYTGTTYVGAIFYTDMNTVSTADDVSLLISFNLAPTTGVFQSKTINIPASGVGPGSGSGWQLNRQDGGAPAIASSVFEAVFNDLDALYISADWADGAETVYLDNVTLNGVFTSSGEPTPIPEPSSLVLLLTAGIPAMVAYRRRKNRQAA